MHGVISFPDVTVYDKSEEEGKDQESIQSNTTPEQKHIKARIPL